MIFKPLFLLVAILMSTTALAADEPAKELTWPMAAKHGSELRYETTSIGTEEKDGKKKEVTAESLTVIRHRSDPSGGFFQVWSFRDSKLGFEGYDDVESQARQALSDAFADVELEVSLDKDGYYSKIINAGEIAEKMTVMLRQSFDEGTRKDQQQAFSAEQKAKFDAIRKNMIGMMTNPVAIENIVGKTPQFFNFFSGGGLDPTTAYALDEEGANPFGGKPFPLKVHMELNLFEDDPGFVQATYISSLDKEKGVPILIEAVEKMLNEKFSEADRKMIGENVEVTNRADMRIRLSDGVVQFYKQTETKSIAGKKEVNLMEMTLLETP